MTRVSSVGCLGAARRGGNLQPFLGSAKVEESQSQGYSQPQSQLQVGQQKI